MRDVVVARTAAKGESARDRRHAVGIEGVNTEHVTGALDHRRKTTVEIEVCEFVDVDSEAR